MKRRRLWHNHRLKSMSLLLAVLSWLIVKQITNNDMVVTQVPVTITFPDGWAIRDKDINEVQIRFLGTNKDLAKMDRQSVKVNIDLRNEAYEPVKTIQILPRHVTFAGGNTRIASIQPDSIQVQLGREGQKKLPVVVNLVGQPPEGVIVEAVEVEPNLATLVGAADLLEGVNALQTTPLNLAGKIQSFEQRLEILPPHPEWIGRVDPARVLVKVNLTGLTVEKEFSDVPLMLTYQAGHPTPVRQEADPSRVDIFLKGSPQLLEKLDVRRIQAFVSAENLEDPESNQRKVFVQVPAGIEVLATQPEFVRVRTLLPPTPTPKPTPLPAELPETSPRSETEPAATP